MADNTSKKLRTQMMYQVFVRNYSKEGTFRAVMKDLDRIKSLGTDIIWLMPIHPIGQLQRKGNLGSPYAISDFRRVNPEFGTIEDFAELVGTVHDKGMKCIIDVVYNHTSPDSVLAKEHPEWFYHRADGSFGNRVGDWSDIIDLDYSNKELWDYQIETLKMWAEYVDGFRCDVAPMIPIKFWEKAREEVGKVRKDCIWLSESIEPGFIKYLRSCGLTAHSDCEIYRAFDMSYEYDCYNDLVSYLKGSASLKYYADSLNRQEYIYPENYIKLRFLENHDQPRARFYIPDIKKLRNMTAFTFFRKGTALIYNGQEKAVSHLPDLFDKDEVLWDSEENTDLSGFIRNLADIKKKDIFAEGAFEVRAVGESFLTAVYKYGRQKAAGIFSMKAESASVPVDMKDGIYTDLISGKKAEVFRGCIASYGEPIILISDGEADE